MTGAATTNNVERPTKTNEAAKYQDKHKAADECKVNEHEPLVPFRRYSWRRYFSRDPFTKNPNK
jgi:hypothetical protein